jgi:hypothetical protein
MTESEHIYWREYRRRPEVMARERARAQARRDAPGGAELNRARVKANRAKLGRNYIAELLRDTVAVPARAIPDSLIVIKRESLLLKRMAKEMRRAAAEAGL